VRRHIPAGAKALPQNERMRRRAAGTNAACERVNLNR
jgi:hypothetical protein